MKDDIEPASANAFVQKYFPSHETVCRLITSHGAGAGGNKSQSLSTLKARQWNCGTTALTSKGGSVKLMLSP